MNIIPRRRVVPNSSSSSACACCLDKSNSQNSKGGCVCVAVFFYQILHWNSTLSNGKRLSAHTPASLLPPSERPKRIRRRLQQQNDSESATLLNVADGTAATDQRNSVENAEKAEEEEKEEKEEDKKEEEMEKPIRVESNSAVDKKRKKPGVVAKLMGIDSFPFPSRGKPGKDCQVNGEEKEVDCGESLETVASSSTANASPTSRNASSPTQRNGRTLVGRRLLMGIDDVASIDYTSSPVSSASSLSSSPCAKKQGRQCNASRSRQSPSPRKKPMQRLQSNACDDHSSMAVSGQPNGGLTERKHGVEARSAISTKREKETRWPASIIDLAAKERTRKPKVYSKSNLISAKEGRRVILDKHNTTSNTTDNGSITAKNNSSITARNNSREKHMHKNTALRRRESLGRSSFLSHSQKNSLPYSGKSVNLKNIQKDCTKEAGQQRRLLDLTPKKEESFLSFLMKRRAARGGTGDLETSFRKQTENGQPSTLSSPACDGQMSLPEAKIASSPAKTTELNCIGVSDKAWVEDFGQPSPVSILDSPFQDESTESSPSPVSKYIESACTKEVASPSSRRSLRRDIDLVKNRSQNATESICVQSEEAYIAKVVNCFVKWKGKGGTNLADFISSSALFKELETQSSEWEWEWDDNCNGFSSNKDETYTSVVGSQLVDSKKEESTLRYRKLVFDCVNEALMSFEMNSGGRGLTPILGVHLCNGDTGDVEKNISNEVREWKVGSGLSIEELVQKDLNGPNGTWTKFMGEAIGVGLHIEQHIFHHLLHELLFDISF